MEWAYSILIQNKNLFKMVNFMLCEFHFNKKREKIKDKLSGAREESSLDWRPRFSQLPPCGPRVRLPRARQYPGSQIQRATWAEEMKQEYQRGGCQTATPSTRDVATSAQSSKLLCPDSSLKRPALGQAERAGRMAGSGSACARDRM